MTNRKAAQNHVKVPRTRWGPLTRYESETGNAPESPDAAGSTKNFPSTFVPMKELEESLPDE